jgi:hypothetical protein
MSCFVLFLPAALVQKNPRIPPARRQHSLLTTSSDKRKSIGYPFDPKLQVSDAAATRDVDELDQGAYGSMQMVTVDCVDGSPRSAGMIRNFQSVIRSSSR